MSVLKLFVMRLFATALISSAALALSPDGGTKKILRSVCGFAVAAALLSPVSQLSVDELDIFGDDIRIRGTEIAEEAEKETEEKTKSIIEEKCAAYILDKAMKLGMRGEVRIEADKNEDGLFYPAFAVITTADGAPQEELEKIIAEEIGIPADKQKWCINE